ncbi:methyltransferase-like 26 isoform X1 [Diabrotica virgifera virgifera]|uniref:Methyltransferase-like 26 isoform X1 n=2 Tax=Diabrotica virgifera virgifera TaxID=50390 RepID=A0A6P7G461_DIAVI|nr:methyltransferase-like 26 isoform X1 [Diabrotica virgifera virgifera]
MSFSIGKKLLKLKFPFRMEFLKQYAPDTVSKQRKKVNFPSADRNKEPILEVLKQYFDNTIEGKVIEISSGTGQHAAHFAPHFPKLTFQPTENEPSLLESISAYAADTPTKNVKEPLLVNVVDDWTKWNVSNDFDYAINVNMIHVTPFSCTIGLFKNISSVLKPGGLLVTYGAYANNGVLEPESNRQFDKSIRQRDPNCGVRDIQDIVKVSESYGIKLKEIIEMPANNKCLIWQKNNE